MLLLFSNQDQLFLLLVRLQSSRKIEIMRLLLVCIGLMWSRGTIPKLLPLGRRRYDRKGEVIGGDRRSYLFCIFLFFIIEGR